ncbi:GNAT family N-acetyltransferase [Brevibacillus migulae]|uniref:GNAT family N-acetyltransferase n=1 Tax=Brevibacillus migulae TaxID=1644114 RepID=UPI00106E9CE0|nr:GNAT family N-acetyltransferase [Brevibacillus migulae]
MGIYGKDTSKHVTLCFYRPEHSAGLSAFYLPEEQKQFTALPAEVLSESLRDSNRHPVVITAGEKPVGFFVLHHGKEIGPFTSNERALLLRAFSIDHVHQGMGYAKAAMLLLPAFTAKHFPDLTEIVLAVNARNLAAKRLYEKTGFQDKGITRMGKNGLQHVLHYELPKY